MQFGYVETLLLWFGDASAFLRWQSGSGLMEMSTSILTLTTWVDIFWSQ